MGQPPPDGEIAAESSAPSLSETYRPAARRIITATLAGNDAWNKMEQLCDGIGHRLTGSPQLQRAVEWAVEVLKADGHENVRAEPVMVRKWVRGAESLEMCAPRAERLVVLGLGGSVGTPDQGLTAPALVVADEDELAARAADAEGKIVVFNHPMPAYDPDQGSGYGTAVHYRHHGARLAAASGAVACLVRSVTANSLRSPHTGAMSYRDADRKIPAAAISVEDAEMLARLARRGQTPVLTLKMGARDEGMVQSANVVAELRGRERPEEIVVISGHFDSWDAGQGAHDDAGGCVMAMEAINVLRRLKMTPRRTIRVVLWTNEENGLTGAKQYVEDHATELAQHVAAIESDSGVFQPQGFSIDCRDAEKLARAEAQMNDILELLRSVGDMRIRSGWSGADVGQMKPADVVLMGLDVEGSRYFDYHHSHADTLDKVNPADLSRCVATMAVVAYVLADMPRPIGE